MRKPIGGIFIKFTELSKSAKVSVIHAPTGKGQRQRDLLGGRCQYLNEWLREGASKRLTHPCLQNSSLAPPPPGSQPLPSFSGLGPTPTSPPTCTTSRAFPLHITLVSGTLSHTQITSIFVPLPPAQ